MCPQQSAAVAATKIILIICSNLGSVASASTSAAASAMPFKMSKMACALVRQARARARASFEIEVRTLEGGSFWVAVRGALLIEQLKEGLAGRVRHPAAHLRLVFGDQLLRDARTVAHYHLTPGAVLTLVKADLPFVLFVVRSAPSGEVKTGEVAVEVRHWDTIENVKVKIEEMGCYILASQQRLTYRGQQLVNGRTVSDYNLQPGSLIEIKRWPLVGD